MASEAHVSERRAAKEPGQIVAVEVEQIEVADVAHAGVVHLHERHLPGRPRRVRRREDLPRRHALPRDRQRSTREREGDEVPQVRILGGDLVADHARDLAPEPHRLDRRAVVGDGVVIGGDADLDARGDERADPIFEELRSVGRDGVEVQVRRDPPARIHHALELGLDLGDGQRRDGHVLLEVGVFETRGRSRPCTGPAGARARPRPGRSRRR